MPPVRARQSVVDRVGKLGDGCYHETPDACAGPEAGSRRANRPAWGEPSGWGPIGMLGCSGAAAPPPDATGPVRRVFEIRSSAPGDARETASRAIDPVSLEKSMSIAPTARFVPTLLAAAAGLACAPVPVALGADETTPHAGMLRYPDISAEEIVFVYANDLWIVPRDGGLARPLASPPGPEMFPKFNDAGDEIVFQGNYDGGRDLYRMTTFGGVPVRLTHRPGGEAPTDWHPEHGVVFFTGADRDGISSPRIYMVSEEGGLPTKAPVPYGGNASFHEDGEWMAYTPWVRDQRTWKRYRGGMAADIWLFNVKTNESRQITDWEGTDTFPMWHKDTVYYLSDAGPEGKLNIWSYDTKSGKTEQVTTYDDYDVKYPSMGPGERGRGEIIFQHGGELTVLDLRNNKTRVVEVRIPGARPEIRPHAVEAAQNFTSGSVSATGKRAVAEARGDIWTIPVEHGPVRQLTNTSGAAERAPTWSPDGRWVSYFSDADGEYELYVTQSDGKGETRQLTDGNKTYFFGAYWSPDSETIAVTDKAGNLMLVDVETGETETIETDPWGNPISPNWSGDSRWITWARGTEDSLNSSIWLYDTETGEKHKVTSGFFNDTSPAFSRKGDYLFYASNREFASPMYDHMGSTFVYANTAKLIAVPLNGEVENPWLIEPDDETWEEPEDETQEVADEDGDDAADEGEADTDDESDADDDGTELSEDDPMYGLDTEHPLFGVWSGTARGFQALGMPQDEMPFTMTILVDEDGNIMGQSESQGETGDLGDVVRWDASKQEFYREKAQGPISVVSRGTVNGDEMTGTWSIDAMGASGTWDAKRSTREIEPEVVEEIRGDSGDGDGEPVEIDLDGFEARGMELPVSPGNFGNLASNDAGQLLYVRGGMPGTPPAIKLVDVTDDKPEEKTVLGGAGGFDVSGDGKKIIAMGAGGAAIVDAKPGQSFSKTIPMSGLRKVVDPREEWEQVFTDAWRRHRDFFYVENMHGVDWDAVYERYHAMLADAASREDVSYIIGEMIGELNVGHAYYWGGDVEGQPSESVGLLGADFELASETDDDGTTHTAYKITKIYEGAPWDSDARGPLSQPGLEVGEGDYITHVNGAKIDTAKDPWAAFLGLAGKDTTLTVVSALAGDDETRNEREITIKPIGNEFDLRYRDWVEDNRHYVEEASSGKVGYIHVPNTGVQGQNELFRQFYGQMGKEALIIDERWNGGGQIPNRFIELLNRPRTNYWARRDGKDWAWPVDSHQGPKCMLINGMAGSGGDMFPWLFRHHEIGKLIGTRTWGGLVGISGVPGLIDGGYTAVPNFGFYEKDGTWGIEGHGVEPDVEVIDNPTEHARGRRPQLDIAINHMLDEIEKNGYEPPRKPAPPVRTGVGIAEEDK